MTACGNRVDSEKPKEIDVVGAAQSEKEQSITTQEAEKQSDEPQGTEQEIEVEKPENDSSDGQEEDMDTKTLVVYFSCTGTTKPIAEYVTEMQE